MKRYAVWDPTVGEGEFSVQTPTIYRLTNDENEKDLYHYIVGEVGRDEANKMNIEEITTEEDRKKPI